MKTVENYGTLPAGDYYVGDLCYVVENWNEYCSFFFPGDGNTMHNGIFTNNSGVKFANYGTAFGDGVYRDEEGNEYAVDSGSIGCIPVEAIREPHGLGKIINFPTEFDCEFITPGGVIRIGDVFIHTDYVGEDNLIDEIQEIDGDFLID